MSNHNDRGRKPPRDYDVGYGKPPKSTQFKKGQSGNPKGRPKKNRDQGVDVTEILERPITVKVNGTTKRMQAYEAALRQKAKKALQDHDVRALCDLIKEFETHGLFRGREGQRVGGVIFAPPGVAPDDWLRTLSGAAEEEEP